MGNYTTNFMNLFPIAESFIDYTIMLLDKHGDYRYDMEDKDKEQVSFLEARMDSLLHKKDTIQNNIKSE
jgi:hypothetical protein